MLAGNPALDLANTLHWRDGELVDFVPNYRSLVEWAAVASLLTEVEKAKLLIEADRQPNPSANIHRQWQDLRNALKAWLPTVNGKNPKHWRARIEGKAARSLMAKIGAITDEATLADYFAAAGPKANQQALGLPLLRSVTAIWQLLTFPPAGLVRQCEADSCGGFFIDQSRAKPRRWCSMDSCGNRAKAARFRKISNQ